MADVISSAASWRREGRGCVQGRGAHGLGHGADDEPESARGWSAAQACSEERGVPGGKRQERKIPPVAVAGFAARLPGCPAARLTRRADVLPLRYHRGLGPAMAVAVKAFCSASVVQCRLPRRHGCMIKVSREAGSAERPSQVRGPSVGNLHGASRASARIASKRHYADGSGIPEG